MNCPDGLPLLWSDLQHQRVVQAVDQVDGAVERFVAGCKGREDVKFEKAAALDAFDGPARELKSLAAQPVDGRLNAAGDAANADSDAEGERLKQGAQAQKQIGKGGQFARNGLELIPGGHGIGQPDEFQTVAGELPSLPDLLL